MPSGLEEEAWRKPGCFAAIPSWSLFWLHRSLSWISALKIPNEGAFWPFIYLVTTQKPRCGSRSPSITTSDLNYKKEFVAVKQFSKRPLLPFSHSCQSLKRFGMVNKKLCIDRRNCTTYILRIKEAAAELCVFGVAYWWCFHDGFPGTPWGLKYTSRFMFWVD